jgi:drug/metabolite transporter (DMT)-like permease
MNKSLAVAALVLNAATWGLAWWPIRLLTEAGLHPLWATAVIYATATVGLALAFRRTLLASLRASRGLWWLVLASGLTNASFNWAVTLTDVARVALLFYLMPVWAALLARWLLKEPLTWLVVGRIGMALAGAAFVFLDPWREPGSGSWMADALAVTAGMSFAVNTVMLRKVAGQSRGAIALAMFSGGALMPILVGLLLTLAGHSLPVPAAAGPWIGLVAATAVAYVLGNLALQYGAARLPANTTSLIMLTEVGVAAVSGSLIAGETVSQRVAIGGALIVMAAASSLLMPSRDAPARPVREEPGLH